MRIRWVRWNKRRKFRVAKRLARLGVKHPFRVLRYYLDHDHYMVVNEIEKALARIEAKGGSFTLRTGWMEYLGTWDYYYRYRLRDDRGVVLEN